MSDEPGSIATQLSSSDLWILESLLFTSDDEETM